MSARHRRKLIAVVNPRGGNRRGLAVTRQVTDTLTSAGIDLDVRPTRHPGHATEIAKTVDLGSYDGFCVVGGDGTTHEVVEGLMQRSDKVGIPLALIPAGTGNTLHHHLECGDTTKAVERIISAEPRPLDVVRVTMGNQISHSVNIIGWGAIADINVRADKLRMLGPGRYAVAALAQILRLRSRHATVILDGDTVDDDFVFVLACNTRTTGSKMILAPQAAVDDGMLDVVMLRKTSRLQTLRLFMRLFNGSHLSLSCVEYRQVRSLTLKTENSDPLNLDGEIKGTTPFVAQVMAGALRVF